MSAIEKRLVQWGDPTLPNVEISEDPIWKDKFFHAARTNNVEALKLALPHIKNVNVLDKGGATALHRAAAALAVDAVDLLLKTDGIDATKVDRSGRTAAGTACAVWSVLADDLIQKLSPHCYPKLYEEQEQTQAATLLSFRPKDPSQG